MVFAMQSVDVDGAGAGRYSNPWLFGSRILDYGEDDRSLLGKSIDALQRRSSQLVQSTIAVSRIIWSDLRDIITYDGLLFIPLLFRGEAFVRDYRQLADLDTLLQNKVFEMALATSWSAPISDDDRQRFLSISNRYIGTGSLFQSIDIGEDTSYADLLKGIKVLNSRIKEFLVMDSVNALSMGYDRDGFVIVFTPQQLDMLQEDYSCARGIIECIWPLQDFVQDIESITETFQNSAGDASDQIIDAVQRFKLVMQGTFSDPNTLTPQERDALNYQQELLKTIYGLETESIIRSQGLWEFSSDIEGLADFLDSVDVSRNLRNQVVIASEDLFPTGIGVPIENLDPLALNSQGEEDAMQTLLLSVLEDTQASHKRMLTVYGLTETSDLSLYFVKYTDYVTKILGLIGSKDIENCLIYNLGKSCEGQCENVWWRCWY
jgi:hypothetical protein